MDIITRRGENVNIFEPGTHEIVAEIAEKWTMHKKNALEMAERLEKIGQYRRAFFVRNCSREVVIGHCEKCGKNHVLKAQLCRDRMCPICNWRLSMKRYSDMCGIITVLRERYPESEWQFVTLTVKNCKPDRLGKTIDEMSRAWNYIMSRPKTKERIIGWAKSLEVTYNAETKELHPHFHVLTMWEEGYAVEEDYLTEMWMKSVRLHVDRKAQKSEKVVTKAEYIEQLEIDPTEPEAKDTTIIPSKYDQEEDTAEAVREAVLETFKYSIKSKDTQEMPLWVFRKLDEDIKGRRLVAYGGVVKEIAAELGEEELSEEETVRKCYQCGSVKMVQVIGKWVGEGYIWRRGGGIK